MLQLVGMAALAIPVLVTSEAEDKMARRLSSEVTKEVKGDARFLMAVRGTPGAVDIRLPARVGYRRRLDWTEISYQARLNASDGRTQVIAGHCWNWNLKACAKQIVDGVVQFEGQRPSSGPSGSAQ